MSQVEADFRPLEAVLSQESELETERSAQEHQARITQESILYLAKLIVEPDQEWKAKGVCTQEGVDKEIWFPLRGASTTEARRICRTECEVQQECLDFRLKHSNDSGGIWGGTTLRERRHARAAAKSLSNGNEDSDG